MFDFHTHQDKKSETQLYILSPFEEIDSVSSAYTAIGIHPWDIPKHDLSKLKKWFLQNKDHQKVSSFGEMGLDRFIETSIEEQLEVLDFQLKHIRSETL
jgi:TatD DNase family protein